MEETTLDSTSKPGHSRLWLVVAVAFVAAAVWAGMALAASRSASAPTSPAFAQSMSTGYVASKAAPGNCPNMGGSSGSSSGSTTTPGL